MERAVRNNDQYGLLDDDELTPYEAELAQIDTDLANANRGHQLWRLHISACRNITSAIHSFRTKRLLYKNNEQALRLLENQAYCCAETGVPLGIETARLAIQPLRWVHDGWLMQNDYKLYSAQCAELKRVRQYE